MQDRSQLKNDYKNSDIPMGIVQIKSIKSGHIFLCKSKNLNALLNRYKFVLRMGNHHCKELQKQYNEFGPDNISFEILDVLDTKDKKKDPDSELDTLYNLWLEKFAPDSYTEIK